MAVSPDGRHLSVTLTDAGSSPSGADRFTTHVWDVERRREIHRFDTPAGHGMFTPDSRRLLTTTGQELALADGATRDGLFGTAPNTEIAVSPDGRTVAVLKPSGLVEPWDGAVRERLGLMPGGLVRGGERHGDHVRGLWFSTTAERSPPCRPRRRPATVTTATSCGTSPRVPLGRPLLLSGRAVDAVSFGGTVLRTVVGGTVQRLDLDGQALASACTAGRAPTSRRTRGPRTYRTFPVATCARTSLTAPRRPAPHRPPPRRGDTRRYRTDGPGEGRRRYP
ncbi:WD40 repeat domain-containing protein [Streptomyces thermolilacinus]|uniref:Uncharacterized protein n=1 Tax=Streptomyces thermolilacinus SPC6 TaxID=1306406 RepID=A0A1D3DYK5_9ACTN|nr:hypothetical protein [Streptomyces thermolilacinus]OEJ97413.1 hypothetical protein J116_026120 [Streptomyces thermolilacinus SPC6]